MSKFANTTCSELDDKLELPEFRAVAKPLGLNLLEADKVFSCLDRCRSSTPPATIDVTDILWLKRLPSVVYVDAVACAKDVTHIHDPSGSAEHNLSSASPDGIS